MSWQAVAWAYELDIPDGEGVSRTAAKFVLMCLANHASPSNEAWPDQETIAERTGLSQRTVKRCIAHVCELGIIERVSRFDAQTGRRRSNVYRLPVPSRGHGDPSSRGRGDPSSRGQERPKPGVMVTPIERPNPTVEPSILLRPFAAAVEEVKKERKRDPLWDVLSELFGEPQTRTEKSLRGKTVRELREVNATPGGVRARAAEWPRLYPKIDLTQTALTKHWTKLGEEAGYVETTEDDQERAERNRLAVEAQQQMLRDHWNKEKHHGQEAHD